MNRAFVDWAYPSSPTACANGFAATGCWVVKATVGASDLDVLVFAPHEQSQALDYAAQLASQLEAV